MIIRVTWLGLARTVSFQPRSCGSGGMRRTRIMDDFLLFILFYIKISTV